MLKRMTIRKIMVTSVTLVALLLLYFIPSNTNNDELNIKQELSYEYDNNKEVIYLIDKDNYVARTTINGCNCDDIIKKAKDLIEGMIIGGSKSSIIPNGFRQVIPAGTQILDISLEKTTIKINFSKEILEIKDIYEEKMIEAIVYTLTSIDGIDSVTIYVEGELLKQLPNSKKNIPTNIDRNFGINKIYDFTIPSNIISYTLYYVNSHNGNYYYVPVTKYINNENQDKIKVIIKELSSAPIYESNLSSFLSVNAKLLDYEVIDNKVKLNFNDSILNDITGSSILEEVIYTISLSINDLNNAKEVVFLANNEEIYTSIIKNLDK